MFSFSSLNINLTNSTTSVYVMPDNTAYWWGYNRTSAIESNYMGSSASYKSLPTYNLNDITVTTTASACYGGVVSDDTYNFSNFTKACALFSHTTSYNSFGIGICSDTYTYIGQNDSTGSVQSLAKRIYNISTSGNGHVFCGINYYAATITINAIWIE